MNRVDVLGSPMRGVGAGLLCRRPEIQGIRDVSALDPRQPIEAIMVVYHEVKCLLKNKSHIPIIWHPPGGSAVVQDLP